NGICGIISSTIWAPWKRKDSGSSIAWRTSSGSPRTTGSFASTMPNIQASADNVRAAERLGAAEALQLYRASRSRRLVMLADAVRARRHLDRIVTYIIDRNVNYTNVCVAKCNFCAFCRPVGSSEGYVLVFDELFRKIDETIAVGGVQLLLQGG